MAKKTVKVRNVVIIGVLSLLLGFLVGQLLPLPLFQGITLTGTMIRPPDAHKRR